LGSGVWGKTRLLLPPPLANRRYLNILTGEVLAPDGPDCLLATLLGRFPVAVLWSCG
jgi:maltooligosyltrehalose synthase